MKFIFFTLLFLGFAFLVFVLGNTMRCNTAPGSACPALCYQKVIDCSRSSSDLCDTKKLACRAPHMNEYLNEANNYYKKLRYSF